MVFSFQGSQHIFVRISHFNDRAGQSVAGPSLARMCVVQRSSCHEVANEVATRNAASRTHCQLRPDGTVRDILE